MKVAKIQVMMFQKFCDSSLRSRRSMHTFAQSRENPVVDAKTLKWLWMLLLFLKAFGVKWLLRKVRRSLQWNNDRNATQQLGAIIISGPRKLVFSFVHFTFNGPISWVYYSLGIVGWEFISLYLILLKAIELTICHDGTPKINILINPITLPSWCHIIGALVLILLLIIISKENRGKFFHRRLFEELWIIESLKRTS